MGLTLRCGDIRGKCEFVVHGETEEEIFQRLAEHVRTIHGLFGFDKFIVEEFRKFIRGKIQRK